jgi:hypothetical protein
MTFAKWVKEQGRGALARVARHTGKSYTTILAIYQGKTIPKPHTAYLISAATGGEVTFVELLAPGAAPRVNSPRPRPRRRRAAVTRARTRRRTRTTRTRAGTRTKRIAA